MTPVTWAEYEVWGDMLVHRAVLLAHRGPPPEGLVAMHKNDIPSDNRLSNLEWGTQSENVKTSWRIGRGNTPRAGARICKVKGCNGPHKARGYCGPCYYAARYLAGENWTSSVDPNRCRRGHERTPENTYFPPKGNRMCRPCQAANHAAWQRNRRAGLVTQSS